MRKELLGTVSAFVLAVSLGGPAYAGGNIILTGHDNDFHDFGGGGASQPGAALKAETLLAQNGSTLPILTFDAGTELTSALNSIFPTATITNFNPSDTSGDATSVQAAAAALAGGLFSAVVVASDSHCGGCDNTNADLANIASFDSTAIKNFVNAGGGLVGLAGSTDPTAYAYVPTAASNGKAIGLSSGFFQTAAGATLGIPAVNGDQTHNVFPEPGTSGLSSAFQVLERLNCVAAEGACPTGVGSDPAITIAAIGATITTTGIRTSTVPEPGTVALFGAGLAGLAMRRRLKKKNPA